jgi:hypothetical protein
LPTYFVELASAPDAVNASAETVAITAAGPNVRESFIV